MGKESFKGEQIKQEKTESKQESEESSTYIKYIGGLLKDRILANKGEYSETLTIKEDGDIEFINAEGSIASLFVVASEKPENIYLFAKKIQEEFPELEFNFERDKHGKRIKYTVKEKE